MDAFHVRGGRELAGTVTISGAKNSALKLLAATLLTEGRSTLRNVPAIADVPAMTAVLQSLGATTRAAGDVLTLDVPSEVGWTTPAALACRLRASIVVLGPLLARNGRARVALPGGDNIGSRPLDFHFAGLEALGATLTYGEDFIEAHADRLVGARFALPYASVGATENLLMAAVRAEGTTTIVNAAREPEVADLVAFLNAMGAQIEGAGTSDLVVHGVPRLYPAEHAVVPDRIEAGTYVAAAALAGGRVRIESVVPGHLRLTLDKLVALGVDIVEEDDALVVQGTGLTPRGLSRLRGVDVVVLPYPGVPTDLQAQLLVVLTQCAGTSMLTENVYDGRFAVVAELRRMGADIDLEGHHAIVRGPRRLRGAVVRAGDVRTGAALVLAGLIAEGETVVTDPAHVDRGYSDFAGRLRALGADVHRPPAALSA